MTVSNIHCEGIKFPLSRSTWSCLYATTVFSNTGISAGQQSIPQFSTENETHLCIPSIRPFPSDLRIFFVGLLDSYLYSLGLPPTQDASHHQDYYIFSRGSLLTFICHWNPGRGVDPIYSHGLRWIFEVLEPLGTMSSPSAGPTLGPGEESIRIAILFLCGWNTHFAHIFALGAILSFPVQICSPKISHSLSFLTSFSTRRKNKTTQLNPKNRPRTSHLLLWLPSREVTVRPWKWMVGSDNISLEDDDISFWVKRPIFRGGLEAVSFRGTVVTPWSFTIQVWAGRVSNCFLRCCNALHQFSSFMVSSKGTRKPSRPAVKKMGEWSGSRSNSVDDPGWCWYMLICWPLGVRRSEFVGFVCVKWCYVDIS